MKFVVLVKSAPYSKQAAYTAYNFCQAALAKGQQILQIFFYQDGVYNANSLSAPPQDEVNLVQAWGKLAEESNIDLIVCVSSALKCGIINAEEARNYGKSCYNLANHFKIGGLAQFIAACQQADRVLEFGYGN